MIVSIDGRMGQGKTATMSTLGLEEHFQKGKKIFSTYHFFAAVMCTYCNWSHTLYLPEGEGEDSQNWIYRCYNGNPNSPEVIRKLTKEDRVMRPEYTFLNLETFYTIFHDADEGRTTLSNCVFLLDEAYLFADARRSGSKVNLIFNAFIFQSRKRGVDMYLTTHNVTRLDKRIRDAIDIKISCRFTPSNHRIRCRMRDMHTGYRKSFGIDVTRVAGLYDTLEVVVPTGKLYKLSKADIS